MFRNTSLFVSLAFIFGLGAILPNAQAGCQIFGTEKTRKVAPASAKSAEAAEERPQLRPMRESAVDVTLETIPKADFERKVLKDIVHHLLKENIRKSTNATLETMGPNHIRIRTTGEMNAVYDVLISESVPVDSLGHRVAYVEKQEDGSLRGTVGIHPDWLKTNYGNNREYLRGLVRSMFRGNPLLHPHLMSKRERDGAPAVLSYVQQESRDQMRDLWRDVALKDDEGRAVRIGLQAPGALGKTTMSGNFMGREVNPKLVVFIVNDADILGDAEPTYAREFLGSDASKVQRIYGRTDAQNRQDGSSVPLRSDTKLILITRTMANRRIGDILDLAGDRETAFVFDEAHHIGAHEGEYLNIIKAIDDHVAQRPRKRNGKFLDYFMSATMWHEQSNLILDERFLGMREPPGGVPRGKIYAPFLSAAELDALQRGQAVREAARLQMRGSMIMGYSTPLESMNSRVAETIEDTRSALRLVRRDGATKVIVIPEQLVDNVFSDILAVRDQFTYDRAVITVAGTDLANKWRDELNKKFKKLQGPEPAECRALHSQEGANEDALSWIRDEGAFGRGDEKNKHKYLIVDRKVNEGVDIPGVNLIIVLRRVHQGGAGIRAVMQILYRGSRVGPGKTRMRMVDYSGVSNQLADAISDPQKQTKPAAPPKRRSKRPTETRVETEDIDVRSEILPFVEGQQKLEILQNPELAWLLDLAPFDDKDRNGVSALAVTLIELAQRLPRRAVPKSGGSDGETIDTVTKDLFNDLNDPMQERLFARSKRMLKIFQDMQRQYVKFREAMREWEEIAEGNEVAEVSPEIRAPFIENVGRLWFQLRWELADFDRFRRRSALITITPDPRNRDNVDAEMRALARFYRFVFETIKTFRHPWETVPGVEPGSDVADVQILSSESQMGRKAIEIQVFGQDAYAFLAGDLGRHAVRADRKTEREMIVQVRVTPQVSSPESALLDQIAKYHDQEFGDGNGIRRAVDPVTGRVTEERSMEEDSVVIPIDVTPLLQEDRKEGFRADNMDPVEQMRAAFRRNLDRHYRDLAIQVFEPSLRDATTQRVDDSVRPEPQRRGRRGGGRRRSARRNENKTPLGSRLPRGGVSRRLAY